MASNARPRDGLAYALFWTLTGLAAGWFLYEYAIELMARKAGDVAAERRPWLALHAFAAIPLLIIAPFQFSATLRGRYPLVHRWAGRYFLGVSMAAAITAIVLSVTYREAGSRIPLILFGLVWLFMSTTAWLCARASDFANHRKFVVRSVAIALAFVWIRVVSELSDTLFGFIADREVRSATNEWVSFIVPLLVAELWLGWWAALKNAWRKPRRIAS